MRYAATESDVRFFRENGFWLSPKMFDDELLAQAREHLERLRRGEYEKGEPPLSNYRPSGDDAKGLVKIDNGWWADRVMERFATSPEIGEIAARLLGVEEIYLWHDQTLYKPPASGAAGNVGWHQDKTCCTVSPSPASTKGRNSMPISLSVGRTADTKPATASRFSRLLSMSE